MGRAGEFEADILPRSGRPGWDGAGRHVQHSGEQAARAMEPVGGLHAGADAVRKAKRCVAIRVGWFVLARNAAGAAGFCERRSAVGKSQKNRALIKITPGVLSLALGLLAARRFA